MFNQTEAVGKTPKDNYFKKPEPQDEVVDVVEVLEEQPLEEN